MTLSENSGGIDMSWEKAAHICAVLQLGLFALSIYLVRRQLRNQVEQLKKQGIQLEQQAKQLRQQTSLARVSNTQALVSLSSPFNLEMARDRTMAELWHRGHQGEDFQDAGESEQYRTMVKWWLIFYENVYFQTESDLLDCQISDAWKVDIKLFIKEHPVERYWKDLREKYYRGFAAFIDPLIEEKRSDHRDE